MTHPSEDSTQQLRWGVYCLLIAMAVGNMSGRILAVNAVNRADLERHVISNEVKKARVKLEARLEKEEITEAEFEEKLAAATARYTKAKQMQRPFLSANDRSRWMAVRALVEQGTYQIDGVIDTYLWNTIDMVQHRGRDGELHLYSSKPPLLITLLAGEYWLINKVTGMTLESHPYFVGRLMLITVNVLPMVLMFFLVAKLADRLGTTDWGRIFVVAAATMGTMLMPFAVVLNNHIIGAVSAAVALYAFVRIRCDGETAVKYYVLAGLAAAFAAANELPALALLAMLAVGLWMCSPRAWLVGFVPAAAVVVVAFFVTNYAAHASWTPPYMHKGSDDPELDWYKYTYIKPNGREQLSYWQDRKGIDVGEESVSKYAFHVLIGHRGIFSLTPIWLASIFGMLMWLKGGDRDKRLLALGVLALSVICLYFYIGLRPQEDRNYGGMSNGFRWMFWFAPLWLTVMLPAADWLGRTRGRQALGMVLLAFSVLSASYPTWNPWTHPWVYRWLEYCGWQGF